MEDQLFNRQFLLTNRVGFGLTWKFVKISDYTLYHHPNLELTHIKTDNLELLVLGYLFDYKESQLSNYQILEYLSQAVTLNEFFHRLDSYSGQYALIYKSKTDFILLNDACAQYEVYFDTSYSAFGSQPKLLEKVIEPEQYQNNEASKFFSSTPFLSKKVFISDTTHRANIRHLMPNHCIDLNRKVVSRFFPTIPLNITNVKDSATKASQMLKGYMKAVSQRNKLAMAVTGGYDSRVLFLASLDLDCKYFVSKHKGMTDKHYDIAIPKKLTSIFNKEFEVIPDRLDDIITSDFVQEQSIDFPRVQYKSPKQFENHVIINGNISEIARNYYGDFKNIKASELAYLNGYSHPFVENAYDNWIKSSSNLFEKLGYNLLDMFYWEEKMGNWAAKSKTEAAMDRVIYSPFCSRELLVTLLSTKRMYRDSHNNKLYNAIIRNLSPKAVGIPINPCRKQRIIRLMKGFYIYNLYRAIGLKYRFLQG